MLGTVIGCCKVRHSDHFWTQKSRFRARIPSRKCNATVHQLASRCVGIHQIARNSRSMTCIFSAHDDLDRNCPTSNHISDASPEKRKSKWVPKCNATVHQPEPKPLRFIQFYKKSRYLECIFSARDDLRDLKCNSVHRIEQTPTQVGPNSLIFRLSWRVLSKNRRKLRSTTFQCRYDRTGGCRWSIAIRKDK